MTTVSRSFFAALCVLPVLLTLTSEPAGAQYFGQNKVQYRTFKFEVLKTEHFDIHFYPEEAQAAREAARIAERWYARLTRVLDHQLSGRQILVLYAAHPHFEQTNVVEGVLGEGTGGVTESLKRRIVMPVGSGLSDTDHVLGHELVHAFQYDILGPNLNLPLWFIEGMAEYLSIGSTDTHTAVWLRDAAIAEKLPDIDDLNDPRYFPYRFGHAFWAYVGGRWGDAAIAQILHGAGRSPQSGPNGGGGGGDAVGLIESVLGIDKEQLGGDWHQAILATMVRPLGDRAANAGRRIIEPDDENELNVGPALSPDGSRIAFLSSHDRLSIDLFVADAATGRIQRKLISTAADPHFDSLQFIASAGSWDPSGRQLAVAVVREGRPAIAIINADNGNRVREIALPGVDEAFHPAWSPDGRRIAFSGLAGGLSDLFVVDLSGATVRKLTDDAFTDLSPSWAPDSRRLVWSTDRFATDLASLRYGKTELATFDVEQNRATPLFAFDGAQHTSPQWARDGLVYFVSDPDGVPDVYRYDPTTRAASRVTRLMTGVTGITENSPALAVAADGSRLATVIYRNQTYEIQAIEGARLRAVEPAPPSVTLAAAQLPPGTRRGAEVDALLSNPEFGLTPNAVATTENYRPRLSLDYIGQEMGITTTNSLGSYMGGGIAFNFSDVLGDHVVTSLLQVNGSFEDFGGQVGYINRKRRWNYGTFFEQLPYITGGVVGGQTIIDGQNVIVQQELRDRQLDQRVLAMAQYPFGRARRFEVGASIRRLTFDRRVDTFIFSPDTGQLLAQDQQKMSLGEPLALGELNVGVVQDTTAFGATGPVLGHRSRFEVAPSWGDLQFTQAIADVRHYVMPFGAWTIAGRFLHIGRYGNDAESLRLSPLFLGFPNLVRGYDIGSFDVDECPASVDGNCALVNELMGSRVMVTGVELRAPILGAFTGKLESGPIPAEIIGFFDAGVAWDHQSRPSGFGRGTRQWVRSIGTGVRVNAFGYAIVELDAVRALDRPNDGWRFVFNLSPGF
jgi:Tol biopolymer transport system component